MIASLQCAEAVGNESKQVPFDWVVIAPTSISGPRPLISREIPSGVRFWHGGKRSPASRSVIVQCRGTEYEDCLPSCVSKASCSFVIEVTKSRRVSTPLPKRDRNSNGEIQYGCKDWCTASCCSRFLPSLLLLVSQRYFSGIKV